MRKNQKYSREQMFTAIETWQKSGLSQRKYCTQENLSVNAFSSWLHKYRKEKSLSPVLQDSLHQAFIQVKIPGETKSIAAGLDRIDISFPNGFPLNLSCRDRYRSIKNPD